MHDLRDWHWMVAWLITAIIGVGMWLLLIWAIARVIQTGWWPWVIVGMMVGAVVWVGGRLGRRAR